MDNQAYEAARSIDKLDDSVIRVHNGAIGLASPWGTIGGATGGALLGALVGTLAGRRRCRGRP